MMQVFPLLAPITFVVGLCGFQLARNLLTNPEVRVNKAHRTTAVLENQKEGEKYAEHSFRQFLRTRRPEVMPAINRFFSDRP
ncbi:hypothetical protein DM860_008527 [Cuscuta australis]|uniref:NADH-ubiquinone reductase complex 1 MLRQ subunit n=1 Tax=Cuscuta australis TaxID=267555 RepID=A0A328D983_9ASTE|nr:hypothetical protein DM860_008527 [Cuscuta australis]